MLTDQGHFSVRLGKYAVGRYWFTQNKHARTSWSSDQQRSLQILTQSQMTIALSISEQPLRWISSN